MGFTHTLCSNHYYGQLPNWFKDKYNDRIVITDGTLVVSNCGARYYTNEFFEDYQKALKTTGIFYSEYIDVVLAVLGEDGVISKVVITEKNIRYYVMKESYEEKHVWQNG